MSNRWRSKKKKVDGFDKHTGLYQNTAGRKHKNPEAAELQLKVMDLFSLADDLKNGLREVAGRLEELRKIPTETPSQVNVIVHNNGKVRIK